MLSPCANLPPAIITLATLTVIRQADPGVGNPGPQLSLCLIVAGRDERAAAVNGDDQVLVP
jgi:hypothetical protein